MNGIKDETILDKMNRLNADGVDFHPIGQKAPNLKVHCSYTKEDFENGNVAIPRSDYTFWRIIDGRKFYIAMKVIPTNEFHIGEPTKEEYDSTCSDIEDYTRWMSMEEGRLHKLLSELISVKKNIDGYSGAIAKAKEIKLKYELYQEIKGES